MSRQRKTNRGPSKTVVSAEPFTPVTLKECLADAAAKEETFLREKREKEIQTRRVQTKVVLNDPAIVPLVHILNILQWKVRAAPSEPEGPTAKTYGWLSWPTTGIMPSPQLGGHTKPGGLGSFPNLHTKPAEPSGLGHFPMEAFGRGVTAEDELTEYVLSVVYAELDKLEERGQGRKRAARQHALELMLKPYDQERGSLLGRSIKEWKDYAPDLAEIFWELLGKEGKTHEAYRFIQYTAPKITGEKPTFGAVEKYLSDKQRWR